MMYVDFAGWLMMMSEGRDKILEKVCNVILVESSCWFVPRRMFKNILY
jgi:hypothetical protein